MFRPRLTIRKRLSGKPIPDPPLLNLEQPAGLLPVNALCFTFDYHFHDRFLRFL
jgi:hypothetical protein